MEQMASKPLSRRRAHMAVMGAAAMAALLAAAPAGAANASKLVPGSLVVSSSTYHAADVTPGETLPIGCTPTTNYGGVSCGSASADGTYPTVFNNDLTDSNFGVTSPIRLDDFSTDGTPLGSIQVPVGRMVTSFSSKSEMALNFSPDGKDLTFMGYAAPQDALDVSNSNTPGAFDPSNPVPQSYYREVADLNSGGKLTVTKTNAYSGNNGRAAILDGGEYYTAGNAGNGNAPQPPNIILGAGDSLITPGATPGTPDPYGSFNVSEMNNTTNDPLKDKAGKDTNFRGLTIYNNVVYLTKGSGGNGIDTVYYVDTVGGTCPNGVGTPAAKAPLPQGIDTSNLTTADLQSAGVTPYNMCVLAGFPTISQKATKVAVPPNHPFGIWFANPTTLYVADEGDGSPTYSGGQYTDALPANGNVGGLEKWSLVDGTWVLDYTLTNGLNLGQPYTVPGYPTGENSATGLPWAPATDGLRNITGVVSADGTTATIYGVTSTISGGGDQGADPNQVVKITDTIGSTDASTANDESFSTVVPAANGKVVRGVALVPSGF